MVDLSFSYICKILLNMTVKSFEDGLCLVSQGYEQQMYLSVSV